MPLVVIIGAVCLALGAWAGAYYSRELYEIKALVGAWITGLLVLVGIVAVLWVVLHFVLHQI